MKWLDRNILYVVYGFLAMVILFQMWYIWEIKSELKSFNQKEHIVIEVIELEGRRYSDTIRISCGENKNRRVERTFVKQKGL
jgi:hypothetical protein